MNKSYEEWKKTRRNRIVTIVLGSLLLAALAVMLILGLQGGNALEGSWYLAAINGEPLTDTQYYYRISFQRDGKGALTSYIRGEKENIPDSADFTWQADGDRLNLSENLFFPGGFRLMKEDTLIWNISGGSLAIYTDGASVGTLTFQRE